VTPVLICGGIIGMVCLIQIVVTEFGFFSPLQRTEWMTCDCRVR
jgi:hypothetical protein